MEQNPPARPFKHLRLTPQSLADVVAIMSRNGRRAVVKLDDHKVDDPATLTAADLSGVKEVDITSYWVDPDRPTWGRRHFVYLVSGPSGMNYFGDSTSHEVTDVCDALNNYFDRNAAPKTPAGVSRQVVDHGGPTDGLSSLPLLIIAGLLIAALSFLIGRWSVRTDHYVPPPGVTPAETVPGVPMTN
ncbi:MAG TPA: hypothetical protein VF595_08050 [Tepidisphaeraceae bacterium]|jgi:hypothetical protein